MKTKLKLDVIIKILIVALIITHAITNIKSKKKDETIRKELIKEVSKQLYKQEVNARKEIYKIEQKITEIEQKDSITEQKILQTEQNFKNIMFTLKILDNEKIKNDNEIINASDSSDWNWFTIRFPKHNNKLSGKANKITRKSSTD